MRPGCFRLFLRRREDRLRRYQVLPNSLTQPVRRAILCRVAAKLRGRGGARAGGERL